MYAAQSNTHFAYRNIRNFITDHADKLGAITSSGAYQQFEVSLDLLAKHATEQAEGVPRGSRSE